MHNKLSLLYSAFSISFFSIAATVIGSIIQLFLAKTFGASYEMDAYFAVITFPLILVTFIGTPLNSVFIPLFKEASHKNEQEAGIFFSTVFWLFTGLMIFFSALFWFFSYPIASGMLAGSHIDTIQLATVLLKPVSIYLFFFCMFYVVQALHIAKNRYSFPYISYFIGSVVTILYLLVFIQTQGIFAVIYGLLYGALIQFLISISVLTKQLLIFPQLKSTYIISFLKFIIPFSFASMIYRSTPLVDRYFASFLSTGDVAILGYSSKFTESLIAFLATGLNIVLLPITSNLTSKKDQSQLAEMLSWGIRAVLLLVLPVSLYLLFFSNSFVEALFERGNFTPETTHSVGSVLMGYTGALIALTLGGQLTNILYAKKKHFTVVLINLALVPFYIILVKYFSELWGVFGISIAYTILTSITTISYIYFVQKEVNIEQKRIFASIWRFLLAGIGMIIAIFLVDRFFLQTDITLVELCIEVVLGVLVYILLLYVLQTKEILLIAHYFRDKFLKST